MIEIHAVYFVVFSQVQARQQERLQVEQLPEQQEAPAAQALVQHLP